MLHQEWIAQMQRRGVFMTSHHNHFMNAALTDDDLDLTVRIAHEAFGAVKAAHPELG